MKISFKLILGFFLVASLASVNTLATFALAILFSLYIAYSISRRLENLKQANFKIGRGELDTRADIDSKDEIGDLARSFNSMVNDLQRSRAELAVAKKFTDKVMDSMVDFVVVTNMDLTISRINKAGLDLNGYQEHELIGKNVNVLSADRPLTEKGLDLVRQTGSIANIDKLNLNKDGSVTPISVSMSILKDDQDNEIGIVYVGKNISDRKRAEEALRESEERYRDLFENANDIIYVHDLEGNYVSTNHAAEQVFGYDRDEIRGLNMKQVAIPEQLELIREKMAEKLIGSAQKTSYEIDCITKDGRKLTLEVNSRMICENGVPVAVQGIARDITERKQTQEALKNSEERYRELYENANDLIYTHDLQGNFTSLNRAGEEITGYTLDEAMKTNLGAVVAPEYLEAARQMTMRKLSGEAPGTYELEIVAKQGHRVSLELNTRLIMQDGKPVAVQGIGRNISERKRAEDALRESEERYRMLFESNPFPMWAYDRETLGFLAVNEAAVSHYGYTRDEFLHMTLKDIRPAEDVPALLDRVKSTTHAFSRADIWRHLTKDGREIDVEVTAHALIFGGREAEIVIVNDITERKRLEQNLRESEENYRAFVEQSSEGIWRFEFDPPIPSDLSVEEQMHWAGKHGYLAEANNVMARMYNVDSPSELNGKRLSDLFVLSDPSNVAYFSAFIQSGYRLNDAESHEIDEFGKDKYFLNNLVGIIENGKVVSAWGTQRDITERKQLEEMLTHQALHDPLTRLANRVLFRDRVEHALQRLDRSQTKLAVLFLDIDNFKTINDSLGHAIGDELLYFVAERIEACLRPSDTAARLGGDEFAILIEDAADAESAILVAERIEAVLRESFSINGKEVFISSSIGIAVSRSESESPEELLRNADVAMYMAKNQGKDRHVVFETAMHDALIKRVEIEADMRHAIKNREFAVYYQPIMDLRTENVIGMEALARWIHPQHGLIPPSDFIPIAEETNLIVPLGEWILEEACTQARHWQKKYDYKTGLSITVNLSSRQFQEKSLVDMVAAALNKTGLLPQNLILEITENVMLQNTDATIKKLQELKKLGVRFAVDDFGTGYSSLSYLQRFPVDILKIDKSFVDKINLGAEGAAVAKAIITMSETLHLKTIAEGIETNEQTIALRDLGCELGQGFHFARPLPKDDMDKFLLTATRDRIDEAMIPRNFVIRSEQPQVN